MIQLTFIGRLETPFLTVADCPRNGRQPHPPPLCRAHVAPEFIPGLASLEGFSHLIVLYWLDEIATPHLTFTPPFDTQARGIFATRAPHRPNPIGLSVVAFEGFEAPGCLLLRYLDCRNDTALLDIKPYLPSTDSEPAATTGWLTPHIKPRLLPRGREGRSG
jgi:tRNA-Thr(GGU) m(6)t(6)A37 methyltransferase TsaA